jgi:hypothetical protein
MQVESYLLEEQIATLTEPEDLEEWEKKVEELGLEGQKKLQSGEGISPIPFKRMTKEEQHVYQTLFRTHEPLHSYSGSTIPLQILSLIALAEKEGYYNSIVIWHDEEVVDPLVIGIWQDPEQSWIENYYLIGRFGEELSPFSELKALARERWIAFRRAKLEKLKEESQRYLNTIESDADAFVNGQNIDEPRYY